MVFVSFPEKEECPDCVLQRRELALSFSPAILWRRRISWQKTKPSVRTANRMENWCTVPDRRRKPARWLYGNGPFAGGSSSRRAGAATVANCMEVRATCKRRKLERTKTRLSCSLRLFRRCRETEREKAVLSPRLHHRLKRFNFEIIPAQGDDVPVA